MSEQAKCARCQRQTRGELRPFVLDGSLLMAPICGRCTVQMLKAALRLFVALYLDHRGGTTTKEQMQTPTPLDAA